MYFLHLQYIHCIWSNMNPIKKLRPLLKDCNCVSVFFVFCLRFYRCLNKNKTIIHHILILQCRMQLVGFHVSLLNHFSLAGIYGTDALLPKWDNCILMFPDVYIFKRMAEFSINFAIISINSAFALILEYIKIRKHQNADTSISFSQQCIDT